MTKRLFKSILPAASRALVAGIFTVSLFVACSKEDKVAKNITITEGGQSTWTVAYDKLGGNASEFVKAFTKYTDCALESYLETSKQNANEILLGKTSRQETKEALSGITNGFKIAFQGGKLVIAGTDDTWTALALYEFEKKVLKSSKYLSNGSLKIPEDYCLSESNNDPQMIARLLNRGYTQFDLTTEKVMTCSGEGDVQVAQGVASDGKYMYYVLRNSGDSKARVFKYDMNTWKQVAKSNEFNGRHCNDMTLNTRESTLYIAHGSDYPKMFTPIAAGNLAIGPNMSIDVNTGAICYNAARNCYALSQGGKNLVLCNAGFKKVQSYTRTDNSEYTPQGMGCDDYYVYFPMSSKSRVDNVLVAYDWSGRYITTLKINLTYESESMVYAAGNYYVNFQISGSGANLYKVTPVLKYTCK